ncbi:MAG: hypothetical protein R3234_02605 [Thermoanaerobaculia bacterium]|nr:hypothetical protein [Thermoanaerobaculia bacterium]
MRYDDIEQTLSRWLAAERSGHEAEADRALAALVRGLPPVRAPVWLIDAVMARLPGARRWTLERLAALLFVACGAAVAFSRWWFPFLVDGVVLVGRTLASFSLAGWLADTVRGLASLWNLWTELGQIGWLVGISLPSLAALAACSVLILLSARLLDRLLHERSSAHVR